MLMRQMLLWDDIHTASSNPLFKSSRLDRHQLTLRDTHESDWKQQCSPDIWLRFTGTMNAGPSTIHAKVSTLAVLCLTVSPRKPPRRSHSKQARKRERCINTDTLTRVR